MSQLGTSWDGYYIQLYELYATNVNPGFNKHLGCFIGRVSFKYQIMTIEGVPPN